MSSMGAQSFCLFCYEAALLLLLSSIIMSCYHWNYVVHCLYARTCVYLKSSQFLNLYGRRGTTNDVATMPFHLNQSSTTIRESLSPYTVLIKVPHCKFVIIKCSSFRYSNQLLLLALWLNSLTMLYSTWLNMFSWVCQYQSTSIP